jgi:DNA-binding XRE family transcriptional regulator
MISWHRRRAGLSQVELARHAGVSRYVVQDLEAGMKSSPDFAEAVVAAREAGKDVRTFRLWLRHPFRGKRPPSGKGHGGKPQFSYGRR